MRKSHLTGAVMAVAIAAILFVVAIFLPVNHSHPLLSFAAVGATIGTLVLLWAAHRRVRYLAAYFGSIVMSVVLAVVSMNVLDWISISRHGNIGVGGGWSIAMFSLFSSIVLLLALLISTGMIHRQSISSDSPAWPIGRGHVISCAAWASIVAIFALAI